MREGLHMVPFDVINSDTKRQVKVATLDVASISALGFHLLDHN